MEFYTVEEVAGILKTTEHTIRKYIRNGQLTAYKVGKAWRIEKEDLQVFLDTCKASHPAKKKQPKTSPSRPEPESPRQQQLPLEQADTKKEPELQSAVPEQPNRIPLDPGSEEGIIAIRQIPIEPLLCPKCGQTVSYQGPCPGCGETYKI